ncbi:MAG: patatin-like phospholipase family protein, partial [Saprospiraceae bacterium]
MPDASSASLTKEDFIAVAAPALERLRRRYPNPKEDLHVSDVVDAEGNQYVNLVQEGGGVLGIALLGYTYILEMMGIRFMKMAGTSAGAINTMMLTALGEKHEMKSLRILELLSAKPLFDFVDGSALARRLIKTIVSNQG